MKQTDRNDLLGIYFSGTGNTKYCVETFLRAYGGDCQALSIEDRRVSQQIQAHSRLVFGYPVQYSNLPKLLRDFVTQNPALWMGKEVFVIATMGLFSGDGSGMLARLLQTYGATVAGGLHVRMPDSICDEKALKHSLEENRAIVKQAEQKVRQAAESLRNGDPPREGLSVRSHLAGLFGQRLYFYRKTAQYSDKLKVHRESCVGCGLCASLCPTHNLSIREGVAVPGGRCTMCYRCLNHCPKQAITLLGKQVHMQGRLEQYL